MRSIFCILFFLISFGAYTQENVTPVTRNILYIQGGGNSLMYSINYERIFIAKSNFQFSAAAGVGIFSMPAFAYIPSTQSFYVGPPNATYVIPLEANFSFGKRKGKFELGVGYTNIIEASPYPRVDANNNPYIDTYTSYGSAMGLSFLYRYDKPEGGFFLKAGATAMGFISYDPLMAGFSIIPFPKIALGYKFKRCN